MDFEPFRDGEFVDSELGPIPKEWKVATLAEFFPVITGKKNANIAGKKGNYPFFSCSQEVLYTDEFSFDAHAILLAGNGDFNVKVYTGKFEAYQRTYVLIPYDKCLTGFLYNAIKYSLNKITAGFRGSVIKFITKGNIQDFKIAVPPFLQSSPPVVLLENALFSYLANKQQIASLAALRDTLLPKLMNGEIDVSNVKI